MGITNRGSGDEAPPPEANGGLGAEPQRCGDFSVFLKNKAFLSLFWSKFLIVNVFK